MLAKIAASQEPVLTAEAPKDYVSEVLPYSFEEVHARAVMLFDSDARDFYDDHNPKIYELPEDVKSFKELSPEGLARFKRLPLVRPNKFYVFYGAYHSVQEIPVKLAAIDAVGRGNAALTRYAALSQEARAKDIYVWSPDTPYWHSEYTMDGKPLPFKSFFIVHFAPQDDRHTEVEVIEHKPVVRLEGGTHVDIRGIVRDYKDVEVAPTTKDREFLLSCIRQFIDRGVPGRHWFNCRDKDEKVEEPIRFTVP